MTGPAPDTGTSRITPATDNSTSLATARPTQELNLSGVSLSDAVLPKLPSATMLTAARGPGEGAAGPTQSKNETVIPHYSNPTRDLKVSAATDPDLFKSLQAAEKAGIEVASVNHGKSVEAYEFRNKDSGKVLGSAEKSIFAAGDIKQVLQRELTKVLGDRNPEAMKPAGGELDGPDAGKPQPAKEKLASTYLAEGLTKKDLESFGVSLRADGFEVAKFKDTGNPQMLRFTPETEHVTFDRDGENLRVTVFDKPVDNKVVETQVTITPDGEAEITSETKRSQSPKNFGQGALRVDAQADPGLYSSIVQAERNGYSFSSRAQPQGPVLQIGRENAPVRNVPLGGADAKALLKSVLDQLLNPPPE